MGNRTSKNDTNYTYYENTNRLEQDHRDYTYYYDDNGNIIKHTNKEGTVDSFAYDWNNRLLYYKKGGETVDFAYNASGLRVKKHYHITDDPKDGGNLGKLFLDASNDLGIKTRGPDSVYNKGRDIEKVYIKNSPQYLDFTLIHRHIFNEPCRLNLFITLDLDTIPNSGRITLPEDTLTKVPGKAAWEYCIYVNDNDYGFYQTNGAKTSMPFGMLVVKTPGPSGIIKVKISKQLINNPQAIRYTIATFAPSQPPNLDTLFQGGSSAVDIFPGTKETFGGEINGYGESTSLGDGVISDYTIYYLYNGINPIVEYAPNGSILARYIYTDGRHIAKIAGADTHYYHCDALGSPRKMTDESGSVTWSATYYPFGEMTAGSSNTHGFTGKEFDSEMGLNYFCQRYYDPEIGRFMSLDPQDSPASSPYAYCGNQPLNFTDPTGEVMQEKGPAEWGSMGYGGWGDPSPWGAHSWADLDPGLFGGPWREIIPYGNGALCYDWETGSYYYLEPGSLGDLAGGLLSFVRDVSVLPISTLGLGVGLLTFDLPTFKKGVAVFESTKGFAGLLNLLGFGGVTIGYVIIGYGQMDKATLRHEMTHVAQFDRFGALFPVLYLGAGGVNLFTHTWKTPYFPSGHRGYFMYWAYYSNPFEIEAYGNEGG